MLVFRIVVEWSPDVLVFRIVVEWSPECVGI